MPPQHTLVRHAARFSCLPSIPAEVTYLLSLRSDNERLARRDTITRLQARAGTHDDGVLSARRFLLSFELVNLPFPSAVAGAAA